MTRHPATNLLVVGIAGGSGSGKTTLCRQLASHLGELAAVLSCDDYYHSQSHLSAAERNQLNFDHPDAIDFELLAEHLQAFKNRKTLSIPSYDFATHTRRSETTELAPKQILLVEGILLFALEYVRQHVDLKIYTAADETTRFNRRLERDVQSRGRTEATVREQWKSTVVPMYQQFVAPTQRFAQIVVNTSEVARSPLDVSTVLAGGIQELLRTRS